MFADEIKSVYSDELDVVMSMGQDVVLDENGVLMKYRLSDLLNYMTRYLAKNIVAAGIVDQCEIELSYAIGKVEPISVYVNTYNIGVVEDDKISDFIINSFNLSPSSIIRFLDFRKPQFENLVAYDHMGREDLGVKWEDTDECERFKDLLK